MGAFAHNFTQLLHAEHLWVLAVRAGYAPAAYAWISSAFPLNKRQLALGIFYPAKQLVWHSVFC
jgi:hypothetical protein